jgi:YHS domain-containing protein
MDEQATTTTPDIAIDPVCGMEVVTEGAQHTSLYEGTMYYFCGKGCRLDFEDDPQRILAPDYEPSM